MSMKIYNACLFDGTYDDLICYLKCIKDKYSSNIAIDYVNKHIVKGFYDKGSQKFIERKNHDMEYFNKLKEYLLYSTLSDGIGYLNLNFECCVYFHKGKILLIFFGEDSFIKEATYDKRIKYYDYWDNTDEPEDVSEEEWNERKTFYESLFTYGSFADNGLVYSFLNYKLDTFCTDIAMRIVFNPSNN